MIELQRTAADILAAPVAFTVRPNPSIPCEYHVYQGEDRITTAATRKLAEALMWELLQWRRDCAVMTAPGLCGACRHFEPQEDRPNRGSCSRWKTGYHVDPTKLADNEVVVESDEGWGMDIGIAFGCVLWECRP